MEIALVDGQRCLPEPCLRGVCQVCGQGMIPKCGEQNIWHWAHKGRRMCDPWWENEGPWHRRWKSFFPQELHEQVRFDTSGEKHIADVMLPNALVVELQHSAMPLEEMRSREAFYGNMVWIVDASPFIRNLTIFDALPDPSLPPVEDLRFCGPHPQWRDHHPSLKLSYENLTFYRQSSREPGDTMVELVSGRDIGLDFETTYVGHHLALWIKPREIWLSTARPTFLDLGNGWLGRLMYYRPHVDRLLCVQLIRQPVLVERLYSWSA